MFLGSSINVDDDNDCSSDDSSDEWLIDQKEPTRVDNINITNSLNKSKYGFANQTDGVFNIVKVLPPICLFSPSPDSKNNYHGFPNIW